MRVILQDFVTGREKHVDFDTLPRIRDMVQMKDGLWTVAEVVHVHDADGDYTTAIVRVSK